MLFLQKVLPFCKTSHIHKRMPDYDYIRASCSGNGVSKAWTEYMEDCRANGDEPIMYSQFCHYIQQDEQKHRATMHINRKPSEQVEVDWQVILQQSLIRWSAKSSKAYIFVGVMTYSQYAYVEAFLDMKQKSWINACPYVRVLGGVAKILVPDNCQNGDLFTMEDGKTSRSNKPIRN